MKNDGKKISGAWMVLLAAVLWSLNSPLVKGLDLDPFLLGGMRSLIAGAVLLPFLKKSAFRFKDVNFYLMLACYIGQCTCIVLALRMTATPIAVGAQFTAPVWLYLVERKKGERITLGRVWPLLALLAGLALFMCSRSQGATLAGNLVALSTSFWFAGLTYFSKKCSGDNPIGVTCLSNLALAALVLPLFVPAPFSAIAAITAAQWPLLLLLGVLQTGGGYACYYIGLKNTKASTATMLSPLEMVLGPVWVALFLHEYPDAIALFGFVLVIAGVAGEALAARGRETEGAKA